MPDQAARRLRRRHAARLVVALAACWTAFCAAACADDAARTPKPPIDRAKISRLIDQLADDDYFVREKAQAELRDIGIEAFDSLSEAAETRRDVEQLDRINYLLRLIKVEWVAKSDPPDVARLMQNYEGMDDDTRRAAIDQLGALTDPAVLPALCRVIRFERSHVPGKLAAIRILSQKLPADADWQARAKALQAGLEDSPRPAAEWVRAYVLAHDDPAKAVERFTKLTEAEATVFRQFPQRSRPDIVMHLWRQQAELLKRLDRRREAIAAMMQMVALESGGTETLGETLNWLVENQAWAEIDEIAARFAAKFAQDSLLTYALAAARKAQGRSDDAARLVAQALAMHPDDQRAHLITGLELHKRGLIEWSEGEYRHAIGLGAPGQLLTLTAQFMLGESLHDRQLDLDAAKVLDEATRGMEAAVAQGQDISRAGRPLNGNRARAHYFYALHYGRRKDVEKQKVELLEGLGEDQYDAEILIELFRIPDLEASVRDRVRKLIRESADVYRRQIEANPDDDTPYNQLAWLISNTEGDAQEALKASQKSLEIEPGNAGHMDTLARCWFAAGNFEKAVEQQRKAIELEPHSQQMKRQLAEFEAALAKKKATEKK